VPCHGPGTAGDCYEISKKLDYRQPELVVKVYKREKRGSVANAEETGVVTRRRRIARATERHGPRLDRAVLVVQQVRGPSALYARRRYSSARGVALSRRTMCEHAAGGGRAAEPAADRHQGIRCWRRTGSS